MAADPPGQARLRDPVGLGRDEPDRDQGRGQDRLPREKLIGVWWSGAEEDTIPPAPPPGASLPPASTCRRQLPVVADIKKHILRATRATWKTRPASARCITTAAWCGIITVEAIRKAQEKFGKGKAMTGEQVRWGFENLNLTTPA